jgi:MraZ protein
MYGEYRHTLDTKSRTFLPSKLREQLGDDIVLTIVSDKCISVYSREKWNEFEEKLKRLPQISAAAVLRRIYSCTFETTVDVQGRIMIPQNLRVKAELSKNIVSVGVGDHAEIWNDEIYDRMQEDISDADVAAKLIELGM